METCKIMEVLNPHDAPIEEIIVYGKLAIAVPKNAYYVFNDKDYPDKEPLPFIEIDGIEYKFCLVCKKWVCKEKHKTHETKCKLNYVNIVALNNPDDFPIEKILVYKGTAFVLPSSIKIIYEGNCRLPHIAIAGNTYKFCSKCQRLVKTCDFYTNKRNGDGLAAICRECDKNSIKERYKKNKDYYLLASREQYFRIISDENHKKANKGSAIPKHWHPWSLPGKWSGKGEGK